MMSTETARVVEPDLRAIDELALTVCVCSARPVLVRDNVAAWESELAPNDELLIVFDGVEADIAGGRRSSRVAPPRSSSGLSAARNAALDQARLSHVVFLDDDAIAPRETLDAIRRAFVVDGAHVVGVRLVGAFPSGRPMHLTDGLLHYVGVHAASTLGSVWGACFAVNCEFARAHGVAFRDDLGRRAGGLQSGDDTTFVAHMRGQGGVVVFLSDVAATHHVRPARACWRYLLRRAWWQGRSEVRRQNIKNGVRKELHRLSRGTRHPLGRVVVVGLFGAAVVVGAAYEVIAVCGSRLGSVAK